MGLDIRVGMLAELVEEDPEGAEYHRETLAHLDAVLADAGLPPHREPDSLPNDDRFEAQMWGYGGLHHVRRLAAHLDIAGSLPPPCTYEEATKDGLLERYYTACDAYFAPPRGLFARLRAKPAPPRFLHLIAHSDCEGFYIPRDLPGVVFDRASEPRPGIGGMVGSSVSLAAEVAELCEALGIPADLDPEDDAVFDNAESPPAVGADWERFGVETFCLTRLRRACEISLRTGAAVVFT